MSAASGRLRAWVRLGRPQFLAGGALAYGAGAALAAHVRSFDLGAFVVGQVAISATQLMTHYGNDYFDLPADRANLTPTRWSGGSRILPDRVLRPHVALRTAIVCAVLALAFAALAAASPHATRGTFVVLVAALAIAWEYSAPPLRLHARGWGALTAAIVVGVLTPMAGYGMQGAPWSFAVLVAFAPLAIAQFVMILAVDFPDVCGDRAGGKRTVAVRFGELVAAWMSLAGIVTAYAVVVAWPVLGLPRRARAALAFTAPLGFGLAWALGRSRWLEGAGGRAAIAGRGVAWLISIEIAEVAGFVPWQG